MANHPPCPIDALHVRARRVLMSNASQGEATELLRREFSHLPTADLWRALSDVGSADERELEKLAALEEGRSTGAGLDDVAQMLMRTRGMHITEARIEADVLLRDVCVDKRLAELRTADVRRQQGVAALRDAGREFYDGDGVALSTRDTSEEGRTWIQLAKSGSYAGHPSGPFELTTRVFAEIIGNFRAQANPVPIDFEHASEQDPTRGDIPSRGAPATGWIHDLEIRGSDLWAFVEWLEPAKSQIRAGQYRYISPALRFGSKDRVTGRVIGPKITSAGLTNTPFLDGMQPLAAKDGGGR